MTSQLRPTGSTRRWRKLRQQFALRITELGSLPCARCGQPITTADAWDLGHQVDRMLGGTDDNVWPEHRHATGTCQGNRAAGARVRAAVRDLGIATLLNASDDSPAATRRVTDAIARIATASASDQPSHFLRHGAGSGDRANVRVSLPKPAEPPGFDPETVEDVPWLADLLEVPPDAVWPRHMTPPHPSAAGSYGAGLEEWAAAELGVELRWWQRLGFRRQLEHDEQGRLVWQTVVESTPRRAGKSVRLRVGALWRMAHPGLFGEHQLVLHTGRDLAIAREIHRQGWRYAEEAGWKVTQANGKEAIETPDGDRWLVRATAAVYGYDATLAMVDEGWGVASATVDEGLEPAILERLQPQLLLTSTAHRQATPLMRRRIGAALSGLGEDWSTLLMLWAAGPDDPIGEEASWRAASPHWSEDRRRLISARYERAMRGEADPEADDPDPMEGFRAQYLNVWPAAEGPKTAEETVVTAEEWNALAIDDLEGAPLVTAVEAWFGQGVAVAEARERPDGRPGVHVEAFGSLPDAAARVEQVGAPVLLAGKSLLPDRLLPGAEPVGGTSRQAMTDMRRLVDDDAFVHDGSPDLAGQVLGSRARPGPDGMRLTSRGAFHGLKAAVWAVQRARAGSEPREAPAIY